MTMHRMQKYFSLVLLACVFSGCDAHDYWVLPHQLEVNSQEGILTSSNTESLNQDLFVRYQFDYEVQNLSTEPTEVVVSATSYVNTIERVSGQKVWHLAPDEIGQGILTTSQLELGNMLVVNLSCCESSRCLRKDVLCPENVGSDVSDAKAMATFCYDACKDSTSCILQCPDETACETHCRDALKSVSKEEMTSCLNQCPAQDCIASCQTNHSKENDRLACIAQCPITCEQSCETLLQSNLLNCKCATEECQEQCSDTTEEDKDACIELCLSEDSCQTCKAQQKEKWTSCITSCPAENTCQSACADLQDEAQISCLAQCPSVQTCRTHCEEKIKSDCRIKHCDYGGDIATCAHKCVNNPDCYLESCNPTPECQETCTSMRAACYRNCIATVIQCTDSLQYVPHHEIIPCALCGGEGLCLYNVDDNAPTLATGKQNNQKVGTIYSCDLDCSRYPASCVTGCEDLFKDDESRLDCLDMCLKQHLFWCNDYSIPNDYVDATHYQPCCYSDSCHGSLTGVVKTYDVECFNDTSCSRGKYCSSEGICVSSGAASCQSQSYSSQHVGAFWILMWCIGGLLYRHRRLRKSENRR